MKLASYIVAGRAQFGVVSGDSVASITGHESLRKALEAGGLNQIREEGNRRGPLVGLSDVMFLPVIPDPTKIICAGTNYRSHAAEAHREIPKQPSMFIRFADTLVGHDGALVRPTLSYQFDFKGELAIIMGRRGRHIPPDRALDYAAGYTIFIDGSLRDYQRFSVTSGKNWPGTGPLGPWMTTADEIPDPGRLALTTRLNGETVQHSSTDQMIYSCERIISFCSDFTELRPGDVIATGMPEGVGNSRNPKLWMKPGDRLEVEIFKIGTLGVKVTDEK
jgi:2-keto-4-pentenoate hydratase/2-oxohepta-3-ene-1,7-dioic acid hydratase in catechol pathway